MSSGSAVSPTRLTRLHRRFVADERIEPAATRRRLYRVSLLLIGAGVVAFVLVLLDVLQRDGVTGIDAPVQRWADAGRSEFWTTVMTALSLVFGPLVFPWAASIITVVWGITARHLWRPLLLALGTVAGIAAVRVLAEVVGRERPAVSRMLLEPDYSESFPSGHVVGAASFILLIAYLVFSRRRSPRSAAISYVVATGLVIATALSRIYLGYHWATDALGAIALALVVLGAVIAIDTRLTVRTADEAAARTSNLSRPPASRVP